MNIDKPITLDLLDNQQATPALSSVDDMPVIETKPDATNEGAPPDLNKAAGADVPPEQPEESATSATEEHSGEPAKKESRGVQKALDRLTAEREEQRRRAEAAEERERLALQALERLGGKPAEQAKQEQQDKDPEPAKPARKDFEDESAWEGALSDYADKKAAWVARREVQAQKAEEEAQARQKAQQEQQETLQKAYLERREAAKAKHADFEKVAESDVSVPIAVAAAILHSEMGPELQYHLGSNPDVVAKLWKLSPPAQILELGRLEAQLSAPQREPEPKPSSAPRPIAPSRPAGEQGRKSMEEMSMEEYVAARRAQEKAATRH